MEGVCAFRFRHNDLFHQAHLVGPDRVQFVDMIVEIAVRRRIAQRAERIEGLDRFLGFGRVVHALGLVDDHDRICRGHELDGLSARELVILLEDDVALLFLFRSREILAEGIDVDDHDLDRVAHGELPEAIDLLRIVVEIFILDVVEEGFKVFLRDLQIFQDAFPDRHAGDDDDIFLEAVFPA